MHSSRRFSCSSFNAIKSVVHTFNFSAWSPSRVRLVSMPEISESSGTWLLRRDSNLACFSCLRLSTIPFHFSSNSSHFSCNRKLSGYSKSSSFKMHLSTLCIFVSRKRSTETGKSARRCKMIRATSNSSTVGGGNCLGSRGVAG